ncbi:hypothetical protein PHYBLDRAFT_139048 [Phycomyces blakesleeanus NRRL 1555(-)]|uniref:Uncharacterized protein n=1 Tax=Phycomyces blakesleeanus (strain ATCC 8743b / DSM 1359 / FGSC 10004 / NBRC 33097 / NRRL 1555) TaxID=763407 RepID=A0A162VBW9_PHYB8|nr:hypothetical protein PHYBLDRAFT_139048 [Phycomyces blakesleeanus NRRL 1555(-)]OAD81502.1 hypothetical protein PHYBLDRAFT_139048 [Phycomyces blakesleeanus NRRL 1555(-)]|eukprot:XP_018299542.1 hypothetical protein PHYBLDRAFT_139048 [Phycomyces blakesleeanus NRRL 1555(-)]
MSKKYIVAKLLRNLQNSRVNLFSFFWRTALPPLEHPELIPTLHPELIIASPFVAALRTGCQHLKDFHTTHFRKICQINPPLSNHVPTLTLTQWKKIGIFPYTSLYETFDTAHYINPCPVAHTSITSLPQPSRLQCAPFASMALIA